MEFAWRVVEEAGSSTPSCGEVWPTVGRMGRVEEYRAELRGLTASEWAAYLRERSGLPGPRANLELVKAVGEEASTAQVEELLAADDEYLVMCGIVALGRQSIETPDERLRRYATDDRWRVREAVAMALQRIGDADLPRMLDLVRDWVSDPHPLVQRAAAAGVCEPRLLKTPAAAATAIEVCELATKALVATERRTPDVRTLRQALGYCWSVAVAADPAHGLPHFLALADADDPEIAWIVRENTKKSRLAKLLR